MAFKAGFVVMAADGDPNRDKASIKTPKFELTTVLVELMNVDQAAKVCKDLVKRKASSLSSFAPGSHTRR